MPCFLASCCLVPFINDRKVNVTLKLIMFIGDTIIEGVVNKEKDKSGWKDVQIVL